MKLSEGLVDPMSSASIIEGDARTRVVASMTLHQLPVLFLHTSAGAFSIQAGV